MKNLFTYKNNIASGLKRYGKFLLLAISLLFLSNTAWAAPTEMWLWYCGHASNQWNEANLQPVQMQSLGNNRWSFDIDLTVNDYQFFFATSNSKSSILEKDKLDLKDFSPSCATSSTQIEGYNLQGKNNAGRLHVGHSNGDCQITLVVTYKSDSEYIIQVDSPCTETEPQVVTGTTYRAGNNNWLIVEGNKLMELYKDDKCNRYLTNVEITIHNKNTKEQLAQYLFDPQDNPWTDYRYNEEKKGPLLTINTQYTISEDICYRAKAYYDGLGGHTAYGDYVCIGSDDPDPSGTPPSIRIGKQPVVSNLTDVAMNFQIADWGCTPVNTIKVYYTRTDIGIPNNTEPTKESPDVWEFTTDIDGNIININSNTNTTLNQTDLPSGNYNIKAVACNASGCGEVLSDMASFTITACEKPGTLTLHNAHRQDCSSLILYCDGKEVDNKLIIAINKGAESTIVPPTDGADYTPQLPDGITARFDVNRFIIEGLDGNTEYTVTCYQYVPATNCYSEPATYVIEKVAPVIDVEMTYITTKSATANITIETTAGSEINSLLLTLLKGGKQIDRTNNIKESIHDKQTTYTWRTLEENTTYELEVEAIDNKGCQTTIVEEFTTGICYVPEKRTVSGDNTVGKVEATITMENSDASCIYQLFIGDTAIDGSVQEGTGSNLQWIVNQAGTYIVKAWFNTEVVEVPNYCVNAPVEMGKYTLACTQTPTPVISINQNTICSSDKNGATITVTALDGITYKLYKDGVEQGNEMDNGEFTGIKTAGTYSVVAVGNEAYCNTSSTSQAVTLTVIDASASVTINPTTDTTTPWVPVNFTVTSTAGAPYTLVYKDAAGNDVTNQMVVVKKGNSYSLKIPRPASWKPGNSTNPVATTTYTVEASLEGQASCGSTSTLTITLNDTFEICE